MKCDEEITATETFTKKTLNTEFKKPLKKCFNGGLSYMDPKCRHYKIVKKENQKPSKRGPGEKWNK